MSSTNTTNESLTPVLDALASVTTTADAKSRTATKLRYFIYARKSTDDKSRQQRSIGDQIAEAKDMAARLNLQVIDVLTEKQSAKVPGRPIFNAMLDRIEQGDADGIIAWHPDRLSRNSMDAGRVVYLVDLGRLRHLCFPTMPFEASAQGKFMLAIMFGQSKYYSDNLSENITRGKRQKIKSGIWPQVAPIGYLNDPKSKTIVPHPSNGPLIRKAFEMYASGDYTLKEVRNTVIELGLRTIRGKLPSVGNIQHALQNPMYYGVLRYGEEFYQGKHEPLIPQALFDQCRLVMRRRARSKKRGFKPFLYRGQLHCGECGGMITMEIQKGHRYLRCTKKKGPCQQPYVREETIHAAVAEALSRTAIDDSIAKILLERFEGEAESERSGVSADRRALTEQIASLKSRLERLMEAYLERAISVEEFRESKNRMVLEKHEAEQKLAAMAASSDGWLEPARRFVSDAQAATSIASSGDPEKTWKFFRKVGSNLTLRDRRLQWAPRGAWELLVEQEDVEAGGAGRGEAGAEKKPEDRACRIKRRILTHA